MSVHPSVSFSVQFLQTLTERNQQIESERQRLDQFLREALERMKTTSARKVKQLKKTVGMILSQNLVKRARKHNLNISRISEQALISVLDYMDTRNGEKSSRFPNERSFLKESSVDGARSMPAFEPPQSHACMRPKKGAGEDQAN